MPGKDDIGRLHIYGFEDGDLVSVGVAFGDMCVDRRKNIVNE